jgi:hypothetical protein
MTSFVLLQRFGIMVDDFAVKIPKKHHEFLHAQGTTNFPGGIWNQEWRAFLDRAGTTRDDAIEFAAEMMGKYGLTDYANAIKRYK